MSAFGQRQTFAVQKGMSALPPKADMCGAQAHVRLGPVADIAFPNYFVIAMLLSYPSGIGSRTSRPPSGTHGNANTITAEVPEPPKKPDTTPDVVATYC